MAGSIEKRGDNTYRLIVSMGKDTFGNPVKLMKTVHCTRKQAEKELALFYCDCERGKISSSNLTLSTLCDKWMKEYASLRVKKSTYVGYESIIENNIRPLIGHHKIVKLKPLHLQEWINYLWKEKELSVKTLRNCLSLMNKILDTAMKWELMQQNPCAVVALPPLRKKEAAYYTKEEVMILMERLTLLPYEQLKYKLGIILTLFTGLRLGELMGLTWNDIDMDKMVISIHSSRMYRPKVGVYVDTPKTEKSVREVSIPMECVVLLKELKQQQMEKQIKFGSRWVDSGYVIVNDFGSPLFPSRISIWFGLFLKQEGLRKITFHQLRHTHTSILAYLNVDMLQISKRLGHSQLSTTQNTYLHLFKDVDKEVADKMSVFIQTMGN